MAMVIRPCEVELPLEMADADAVVGVEEKPTRRPSAYP
jgi:hypothetical protein